MKHSIKPFFIILLCLTLPVRQATASISEVRPMLGDSVSGSINTAFQSPVVDYSAVNFVESDPVMADTAIVDAILGESEEDIVPEVPGTSGVTFDNIEETLQDDMLIPQHEGFGIKHKIFIGLTVLLSLSVILALVGILAHGFGGFGGRSGVFGGSGNGFFPQGPSNSNPFFKEVPPFTDPVETGGEDKFFGPLFEKQNSKDENNTGEQLRFFNTNGAYPHPSGVPCNPEPATMLLMLLGLGLPFLRKKLS